jgi:YD repeat-containing protein
MVPWTTSGYANQLLPYFLAWNLQPTFQDSGDAVVNLYGTLPLVSYLSKWSSPDASVSSNAAFDFFLVPIPQAGNSRIVFVSNREGQAQVYAMDVNGGNLIRLTNNGSNDEQPRWSPNGTKILFQSDRDSTPPSDPDNPGPTKRDIYVMNADGSGQTRLTTDAADDCNGGWSPDGSKIVFQSLRNGSYYQVYVMNADGTSQINKSNGATADTEPSWSPTGSKIAFASDRDHAGAPSVYSMNTDGSSQTRLTFSSELVRDEQPVWSRDATKLAFVSTRDGNKEIYLMNADGSYQVRLTNTLENDDYPSWSPNGTQIVFRSERERDAFDPIQQLWIMNADGSSQSLISSNAFGDYSPSWSNASGNQAPVANSGGPYSGVIAQNVPFSAVGSFDSDGTIATYAWTFGDGSNGSGMSPTHAFAAAGTYNISLTVTDNLGAQTTANTTTTITTAGSEQYLANFSQMSLGRQPYANESAYWNDILRAAYPRGQTSMVLSLRELGKTVFESADYAALGRSNHWYVYDLYKTYLMREPDAPGWAFWESACIPNGRENVRRAFDECTEFAGIVSTLTPTGSPSSTVSSLASARVDPFNQPGNGLQSRDAEWSVSLLSLPGRAGLDLGLSLSYSSMVWTRSGPYIYFDEDNGWPSPGFRLGFPTLQEKFFDAQARSNVYLMLAGGSRVSLRQVGTSNVYEASDSSYLQLIDYGGSLLVRGTDGTQLTYNIFNNEWRCTAIKDRNGNYISINYDGLGHITSVIDTLARTITFNYDTNANLISITQSWTVNGVATPHTWVSFGWDTQTLQTSFSGVSVVGTSNAFTIPVLKQVGFDDSTYCKFLYNSAGQVTRITHYASDSNPLTDNHPRNYTTYDYQSTADDCPRISATRVWAENWTGINGVPNEVVTQYGVEGTTHVQTMPEGTTHKEFYGTGWQQGLVTQTETWSGGVKQKWTTTSWTRTTRVSRIKRIRG